MAYVLELCIITETLVVTSAGTDVLSVVPALGNAAFIQVS